MFGRQKAATLVAEFIGTGLLTLMVLSVQRSTIGVPFFVAAGAALALAVATYALRETSGAHFNPALTIALWTARKVSTVTGILYIIAQFLGAWAAYGLYTYFVNTHLTPIGGHFTGRILTAETVGTAIFSFGVASTVYRRYSLEGVASFTGVSYMLGVITASSAALGLLNPAIALGVRAWVWNTYVLGPVLGAVIGVNLYALLFVESDKVISSVSVSSAAAAAKKSPAKKTKRAKK